MAKTHDQHLKFPIFDPAQNAVVIHAIAPELAEISLEALAELPGILAALHSCIKELKNPPGRFMAELA